MPRRRGSTDSEVHAQSCCESFPGCAGLGPWAGWRRLRRHSSRGCSSCSQSFRLRGQKSRHDAWRSFAEWPLMTCWCYSRAPSTKWSTGRLNDRWWGRPWSCSRWSCSFLVSSRNCCWQFLLESKNRGPSSCHSPTWQICAASSPTGRGWSISAARSFHLRRGLGHFDSSGWSNYLSVAASFQKPSWSSAVFRCLVR